MLNYSFNLNMTPGAVPPILHMSQYDTGRQYTAYLKDDTNTAYTPASGATAKIKGFNAAGVAWEQAATVDGSTVVFAPSGAATDQFGVMPVTIEITVSDEVITPLLVVFDIQRAGYTNEEAVHSPEFETAIEAAVAAAIEEGGIGFTDEFKQALLACFAHVAWTDEHGQDYYDALEAALSPPSELSYISAVYTQSGTVYDDASLDSLRSDLVVTAHYVNATSEVITGYTLSGTLTEGTSTITVAYGGKTTTFDVTVTHSTVITGYTSVGTPSIGGNEFTPSASGYIKTPESFSPGNDSWAIRFKIAVGSNTTYANMFRSVNSSNDAQKAIFVQYSATHKIYISNNNSTYIVNAQSFSLDSNTTVYLEFAYDGSQTYTVKKSADGTTWTTLLSATSSSKIYGGFPIAFGGPNPSGVVPYSGVFYLDTIQIYIAGSLWWKAA